MKKKIVIIYICMLISIVTVIPVAITSEKTITKPLDNTKLLTPENYEQNCFNISWPSYNKWVRFRFPIMITEICNETHTNVTVKITITNTGYTRLCSVPPLFPRLNPGDSRTYIKDIPTFPANGIIIIKSSILFGWGLDHINITISIDNNNPITQSARVIGHFIAIP